MPQTGNIVTTSHSVGIIHDHYAKVQYEYVHTAHRLEKIYPPFLKIH